MTSYDSFLKIMHYYSILHEKYVMLNDNGDKGALIRIVEEG